MAELEAVKKSSKKATRSWSNADEKRAKNNFPQRERGKNKKKRNLSVSDKIGLLKLKLN